MTHPISLAFLTIFDASAPEAVSIAANAGYDMVGLRLLPAAPGEAPYPLLDDNQVLAETLARLNDTGVKVGDVEIVRLKPDTDVTGFDRFLERAGQLGARNVLVAADDPDKARLIDSFAGFAERAARHGLTADLEFMPWTKAPDLNFAREVVEAAGQPNGGVLIDALHYDRSTTTLDDVRALPAERINYVQLCDGLATYDPSDEGLIRIARGERLFPGEGEIGLAELILAIPETVPLSIEVPHLALARQIDAQERANRAMAATRRVLDSVGRA